MNRMAKEPRSIRRPRLHQLPPLIKGYLRLGAFIGDGAVIDHQFGTTDVLIVLPVRRSTRATSNTSAPMSRHAAYAESH